MAGGLIADCKERPLVRRLLKLIDKRDGIVFERNSVSVVFVENRGVIA